LNKIFKSYSPNLASLMGNGKLECFYQLYMVSLDAYCGLVKARIDDFFMVLDIVFLIVGVHLLCLYMYMYR
jgi:hypothetical protein